MQKHQIFIVDDSRVQLILLKKRLMAAGFSVRVFSDGYKLIRALEKKCPDLIISDIDMPELDGFKLMEKIKDQFEKPALPFFLISSNGEKSVQNRAHKAGAAVFLKKPFKYETLIDNIEKILVPLET